MADEVLGSGTIDRALATLDGWAVHDGKLRRTFVFVNFVEAFGFMTRAALLAEKRSHHPDWSNSYKTVVVDLVTHSAGGITDKDLELARAMNAVAG